MVSCLVVFVVYLCLQDLCEGRGSVVSRSAVSTLSLTLQAVLLITVQALHLRELSIIVACIKYVKDLCCIGGLLLLILYTAKIKQIV